MLVFVNGNLLVVTYVMLIVFLFHLSTIRRGFARLNELVFRYGLNDGFVLKKELCFSRCVQKQRVLVLVTTWLLILDAFCGKFNGDFGYNRREIRF